MGAGRRQGATNRRPGRGMAPASYRPGRARGVHMCEEPVEPP